MLGEVIALIVLPKYDYGVMADKPSVFRFRDLCLAWNPGTLWERITYNPTSHFSQSTLDAGFG